MIQLTTDQMRALTAWFLPDRPGPLVALHGIHTGHGALLADRWPTPRAVMAVVAGNFELAGDPAALTPADLAVIQGFVAGPEEFLPLLRAAHPAAVPWPRLILVQSRAPALPAGGAPRVRRLGPADATSLQRLGDATNWISKTWNGPAGLAASGHAWGAFADERLVSVACSFFVGATYEDLGVATEPAYRQQGLSTACADALCRDIWARGRRPSWTTSPDNGASLRVANRLNFARQDEAVHYVVGVPVPKPANAAPFR